MRTEGSKQLLILIKSVEPKGWQDQMESGEHTTIPPLGTMNEEEAPTSELDKSVIISGFQRNEAVLGSFEPLLGKTSFSISNDIDKIDVQEISLPKEYARGHDTYTGSLEFMLRKEDTRVLGAVDGVFDSEFISYKPYKDFREYEIWVLVNPDVMGKGATKCDILWKFYYCILDKSDVNFETPIKFTVPVSMTMFERFLKWDIAGMSDLTLFTKTSTAFVAGTFTPTTQMRMHSRVAITLSNVTCSGSPKIAIEGTNIAGDGEYESIELSSTPSGGSIEFLSKRYWKNIEHIYLVGTFADNGGTKTITLKDYDWKIR